MSLSRREFLNIMGCLAGGVVTGWPPSLAAGKLSRFLMGVEDLEELICRLETAQAQPPEPVPALAEMDPPGPEFVEQPAAPAQEPSPDRPSLPDPDQVLAEIGAFPAPPSRPVRFDEHKYSPPKRQLEPSEWSATNRHLPVRLDPQRINAPGERSPAALESAVAYIPFRSPRYVAQPGERVSMCNIAAWDWSRLLQVHLPHWMGDTEMSANMLFRWISNPQAGGALGEGWQPLPADAAQFLANRGVPVFALAENPSPGRHGHVALVYPAEPLKLSYRGRVEPDFATVTNGRWSRNGIKPLSSTFRRLKPAYFVHRSDFIVHEPAL
jgi:hypothetical protein